MKRKICVVGLGYVGLPLAVAFGKKFSLNGFDIDSKRIKELKQNYDRNNEIDSKEIKKAKISFSSHPSIIKKSDFIIIAVPTPVTPTNQPDLTPLKKATQTVARNLSPGSIIVYESTVAPGTTEEICLPILEKESGLKHKRDFNIGYSPERINPGDKKHSVEKIKKVVSADNRKTLKIIAQVYQKIVRPGVFKAKSIKVAESAKIIENIQRDLNIALMNELHLIFDKLGIRTEDVLKTAKTKWNFLDFHPGLVGGHCIGVDPYYLAAKAKRAGHFPKLILAGRKINNYMAKYEAQKIICFLKKKGIDLKKAEICVLGATFKPNVKDLRNSKVKDLISYLKMAGCHVMICEPLIPEKKKIFNCFNLRLKELKKGQFDLIVKAVDHQIFRKFSSKNLFSLFS